MNGGASVAASYISCSVRMGHRAESSSISAWISLALRIRQTQRKRKLTRATVEIAVRFWELNQQLEPKWRPRINSVVSTPEALWTMPGLSAKSSIILRICGRVFKEFGVLENFDLIPLGIQNSFQRLLIPLRVEARALHAASPFLDRQPS